MIRVNQSKFGWGEGDCVWACLASIFEEPLASFAYDKLLAPCNYDLMKLTDVRWPHLKFHSRSLCYDHRVVNTEQWGEVWRYKVRGRGSWDPPTEDYWMGVVESQTLMEPDEAEYAGMSALHAVVMLGDQIVHDPNPRNDPYPPDTRVCEQIWWAPRG